MEPQSKVLVYGSLAFDVLFAIQDDFRKSIPLEAGKIRSFNATYIADSKNEHPGGTAGNIAFWLGQEGVSATIFSSFGADFVTKGYAQKLAAFNHTIVGYEGAHTAHAYQVSDPLHQQLIIWQPNSYSEIDKITLVEYLEPETLKNFEYAIFAPGTNVSIPKHLLEFREYNKDATVILDPGQWSPFWDPEKFKQCLGLADILIGNDIEYKHFQKFSASFNPNLIQIETLGERGVKVIRDGVSSQVKANPLDQVVETTGAGDAFRAGFLSILAKGGNFDTALTKGCELGAKCVTLPSAQIE